MRGKHILLFGALVLLASANSLLAANDPVPGWLDDAPENLSAAVTVVQGIKHVDDPQPIDGLPAMEPESNSAIRKQDFGGTSASPEEITPSIAAEVRGIVNRPGSNPSYAKVFLYVLDQIQYEHYYGSKRGAHLTLVDRRGNDADTAALLLAMLRSAGYEARYCSGVMRWLKEGDPTTRHIQEWLGVPVEKITEFSGARGFPSIYSFSDNPAYIGLNHVWVEVNLEGTWYPLDASLKRLVRIAPQLDVAAVTGLSAVGLETAAGGSIASDHVEGLNQTAFDSHLATAATSLIGHIDTHHHDAEPIDLTGGWRSERFLTSTGQVAPYVGEIVSQVGLQRFDTLPASLLSTISLEVRSTAPAEPIIASHSMPMANLQGRRLSLSFTPSDTAGRAQLWIDDTLLAEETSDAAGTSVKLKATIDHPHKTDLHDQSWATSYARGATYALVYGFSPGPALVKERQEKLDSYRRAGLPETAREVVSETLNVIGLQYLYQTELYSRLIGGTANCDTCYHHRVGRVSQERGYFIDVGLQFNGFYNRLGDGTQRRKVSKSVLYACSALEHGVIEQMMGASTPAVSTVKLIQLANQLPAGSRKIFFATPGTWAAIQGQLTGYESDDLARIQAAMDLGGMALLPQTGQIAVNQWNGTGYITEVSQDDVTGTGMLITGNLNGGYGTRPGAVSPTKVAAGSNANPNRVNSTPYSVSPPLSLDPIDLASGDFVFDSTDLQIGDGNAPRGLSFSRHYNGSRRWVNPTGLGWGWTHNWDVRIVRRSAFEPVFGEGGTAYHVASALVAANAALQLAGAGDHAQHWSLSALVAHWLTSQLQDNAAAFSVGPRSLQFVRLSDGHWQAPGGVTMSLAQTADGWRLDERHGNSYRFDSSGDLVEIRDLWDKVLRVTYDASRRVASVTDAYNRSLTFNYFGSALASVQDFAGRTLTFTHNVAGDLTAAFDPESIADRYDYDAEHRVTAIRNHDQAIIATNLYDSEGRVSEQWSHGLDTRKWKYYYSIDCTTEEDPKGGKVARFFDHKRRETRFVDALGRPWDKRFDGQDRTVWQQSPMGYESTWEYDRNHNLLRFRDPEGKDWFTEYDAQLRPFRRTGPQGVYETLSYNPFHQPLTVTNGAQQSKTFTYHPLGTLDTSTVDGQTIAFGYNARDEHTSTSYPEDGISVSYVRNQLGDVLTAVDGRGNPIAFTYNLRRQPVTERRPGNIVTTRTYNNQRLLASVLDPRQNLTRFEYSPTGKPVRTIHPDHEETNISYDERDWKIKETNELDETVEELEYFANGLVRTRRDGLNRPTHYKYDGDGNQQEVANALGHATKVTRNKRAQPLTTTNALGHVLQEDYDFAGRRSSLTNRRNHQYTFGWDGAGRPSLTHTPEGRDTLQSWNGRDLLSSVVEPSGQTTLIVYNDRGLLKTKTDPVGTVAYSYDANGMPDTVTGGGLTIDRNSDELNRMVRYDDGRGHPILYERDNNGNIIRLTYESGKAVEFDWDKRNRLSEVRDWTGRRTVIDRDAAGRLLSLTRANQTVRSVSWNEAGQLLSVDDRHRPSGRPIIALRLGYDAAARLRRRLELPLMPAAPPIPSRDATYDRDNRLTVFNGQTASHDLDGNLTLGPSPKDPTQSATYGWTARNELATGPEGTSYSYDLEGLRASYTQNGQTTQFVNDPSGDLSQVAIRIRPDGTRTFYIYGEGTLLYEIEESTNAARYYHYDHLGSTIALSDDTGQVTARAAYSAYGVIHRSSGTLDTPFLWLGAHGVQTDPNGLIFMRARYFHPFLQRFISEDPLGLAEGSNVFAYAGSDPISNVDPTGLWAETAWDVANIAIGVASLRHNLREGNRGAAILDGVGLAVDIAATVIPVVPGGAGTAIKTKRLVDASEAASRGGRLGNATTRQQVSEIADAMEAEGWTITGGGGRMPEEYLRGPGGARKGSSYPDITATSDGKTIRINTIDTRADGVTPTSREARNAERIAAQRPQDKLITIPKRRKKP